MQTRARLVAAGRRLMAARGLEGVAIADIADDADVGVGSFYNYFHSKQELLDVVTAEATAALGEVLERLTSAMVDPAEIVAVSIRHVVGLVDRDPTWAWLVVRTSDAVPRPAMSATMPIERYVLAGIEGGRFPSDDPTVAVNAVCGVLLRVMRAKLLGGVGRNADCVVAEQVLRLLGLEPRAAHAIAMRRMPAPVGGVARAPRDSARRPSTRKEGTVPCPTR
jgi:AcrR family transcriptional regulator